MLPRSTCLLINAPIPSGVLRRPDTTGVNRKKNWIHADFLTLSALGADVSLNTVTEGKRGKKYSQIFVS